MEKGSMLILAIIATLILSLILVAGLTVSTTEVHTTQNYYMNKVSYYKAVEGVEIVTETIRNESDPSHHRSSMPTTTRPSETGITRQVHHRHAGRPAERHVRRTSSRSWASTRRRCPASRWARRPGCTPVIWYVPVTSEVTVNQ